MIGRTYLERGKPVVVLKRWRHNPFGRLPGFIMFRPPPKNAPRNVLVRRSSGELVVRPFRGLRKTADQGAE